MITLWDFGYELSKTVTSIRPSIVKNVPDLSALFIVIDRKANILSVQSGIITTQMQANPHYGFPAKSLSRLEKFRKYDLPYWHGMDEVFNVPVETIINNINSAQMGDIEKAEAIRFINNEPFEHYRAVVPVFFDTDVVKVTDETAILYSKISDAADTDIKDVYGGRVSVKDSEASFPASHLPKYVSRKNGVVKIGTIAAYPFSRDIADASMAKYGRHASAFTVSPATRQKVSGALSRIGSQENLGTYWFQECDGTIVLSYPTVADEDKGVGDFVSMILGEEVNEDEFTKRLSKGEAAIAALRKKNQTIPPSLMILSYEVGNAPKVVYSQMVELERMNRLIEEWRAVSAVPFKMIYFKDKVKTDFVSPIASINQLVYWCRTLPKGESERKLFKSSEFLSIFFNDASPSVLEKVGHHLHRLSRSAFEKIASKHIIGVYPSVNVGYAGMGYVMIARSILTKKLAQAQGKDMTNAYRLGQLVGILDRIFGLYHKNLIEKREFGAARKEKLDKLHNKLHGITQLRTLANDPSKIVWLFSRYAHAIKWANTYIMASADEGEGTSKDARIAAHRLRKLTQFQHTQRLGTAETMQMYAGYMNCLQKEETLQTA